MKSILLLLILLLSLNCVAQKGTAQMINAEKSFAAYAVANNTPDAFLQFADSNAIVYESGQPVNAISVWSKRPKGGGKLNWRPQFAEVATSGDWGYTTGPWTYQPKTLQDSIVAQGQFSTIWHKTAGGQWKFLVDLGVDATPANPAKTITIATTKKSKPEKRTPSFLDAEQSFSEMAKTDKAQAYKKYLSRESIVSHNGYLPATSAQTQKDLIDQMPSLDYQINGSGIAPSGDLAYVHGLAIAGEKKDSYLRVWRLERSGWKIAMETVTLK